MLSIYERIRVHRLEKGANRSLLAFMMGEITIDGKPVNDEKAKIIFEALRKKAVKNIELYKKADRFEKIADEEQFINYLDKYLPDQASREDIETAIGVLKVERTVKNIGKVIGYLKNRFETVDGSLVKEVLLN